MEDSYTVHRRRKAAARRREKTPEPSSAGLAVVTDDDDVAVVVSEEHLTETGKKEEEKIKPDKEEAATRTTKIAASSAGETMDTDEENERRARMERMVEDTERMELMMGEEEEQRPRASAKARQQQLDVADEATVKTRPRSPASANRPEKAELPVREEESSKGLEPPAVSRKAESPARGNREEQEQQQPEREETEPPQPPVKVSRKPREPPSNGDQLRKKMGSPEAVKVQREPSNGADLRKRMGSPEAAKTRESSDGAELRKRMRSPEVAKSRESSDGTELRKRLGSPEAAKMRARHLSPSSRAPDFNEDENNIKRASSRQRYQQPSDEEEPPAALVQQHRTRRSPSQPPKKQIIPLSDNSLIEDVARAKRAYAHREPSDDYEYEDDEEEEEEEEYVPRRKRDTTVRRRKTSIIHTDREKEEIRKTVGQTSSWFSWIPFFGNKRQQIDNMIQENEKHKKKEKEDNEESTKKSKLEKTPSTIDESRQKKSRIREFLGTVREINAEFKEFCRQNPEEVQILYELRNLCIVDTLITIIVCGLGGLAFRFTEGAFESFYKCGVKRVKRDFLDTLWNYSHNMKEDDWKSMARRKLMDFEEQLHAAHEAGVQTYSGQRSWTFLNAVVYCLTIISTIGYGHISPSTTTGRALTIIYAIFGIPMFLIVLADFGKLFTRGIKFLWAFVRRLYYTGSCRQVRRTVPMQEMMKGVQLVYDLATFRRPSQMTPEELEEMQRQQKQTVLSLDGNAPQQPDSPSTPAMSTFEIDDEFNLPISVAITILVLYIFIGATVFNIVEDWTFFESFYFVFISMSTIGFGDFVPQEPLYMMLSIVYLIFGLALTSMCINVVQVMLTDQFKHASQKIGASIGFHVSDEDGSLRPAPPEPVEIAEVHNASTPEEKEKIAPKAKQEDVDL